MKFFNRKARKATKKTATANGMTMKAGDSKCFYLDNKDMSNLSLLVSVTKNGEKDFTVDYVYVHRFIGDGSFDSEKVAGYFHEKGYTLGTAVQEALRANGSLIDLFEWKTPNGFYACC